MEGNGEESRNSCSCSRYDQPTVGRQSDYASALVNVCLRVNKSGYNEVADVAITYEQGENIYIIGTIQQRKYTPADGSPRTVHEIHVRSCHLIAATRLRREEGVVDGTSIADERTPGGNQHDDGWPVSPA